MEDMENGSESIESGESEGATSDASDSGSDTGATTQVAAPKQEQEFDWSKAFEHPRFKELIGQKNEAQTKYQEMESRYKTLEQQLNSFKEAQPKAPTETDQLLEDLKKVDPRLAKVIESQLQAAEASKQMQARLEQFEKSNQESAHKQVINNALTKINTLHESNKMSDFGKQFINNQLDIAYRSGQLNAQDLSAVETAYKQAHDAIKTYEDSMKRSLRESYVQDKKKDAAVPASVPKGTPAKAQQKSLNVPKDKEALKSAVVKSFLKEQAAARDATNN